MASWENEMFDLNNYQKNIAFYDDRDHYILYEDISIIAEEILDKIGSRNLVYLLCDNTLGALAYYAAFLCTDNVVQLVSKDSREEWNKNYCQKFQPAYLCVPVNYYDNFLEVHRCMDYCILKNQNSIHYDMNANLALLITSSGSTGECKFVRHSKRNLIVNTKSIIKYLEITDKDRPILSLPMSYTYGLSVINTHLFVGATILISQNKIIQQEYWDFFNSNKGTSISGVPYSYELLYHFGFLHIECPYLNCMTQAGGKLSNDLIEKYNLYAKENGIRFYVMYGQTEATARMSYLPYQYAWKNEKVGSVGIAVPGTKIYLEDDKRRIITKSNCEGEVIFEGENVAMGYANSYKDLNRDYDNQGILKTGDIAYYDDDGFLYISGRKKRFVKICGKRLGLDSIETYISEQYGYEMECAVVGDDTKIYVVINKDVCDALKRQLMQYYHIHKDVLRVFYMQDIPKTISGKKDYNKIMKKINVK